MASNLARNGKEYILEAKTAVIGLTDTTIFIRKGKTIIAFASMSAIEILANLRTMTLAPILTLINVHASFGIVDIDLEARKTMTKVASILAVDVDTSLFASSSPGACGLTLASIMASSLVRVVSTIINMVANSIKVDTCLIQR